MTDTKVVPLEPCPFCGGPFLSFVPDLGRGCRYHCDSCRATTSHYTNEPAARMAWNRRAEIGIPIGLLKEAIDNMADSLTVNIAAPHGSDFRTTDLRPLKSLLKSRLTNLLKQQETTDTRTCTCHPDDRFYPCRRKYAVNDCRADAALNARDHLTSPHHTANRDQGAVVQQHQPKEGA